MESETQVSQLQQQAREAADKIENLKEKSLVDAGKRNEDAAAIRALQGLTEDLTAMALQGLKEDLPAKSEEHTVFINELKSCV